MGFFSSTSVISCFLASIGIIVCWTVASGDQFFIENNCGGCIYMLHNAINEADDKIKAYYNFSKDIYPYLLALSLFCAVLWIITAGLVGKPKYHLIMGILLE